ncbi:MAG: DUF58 domain-containing protein [Acidobacteria bacterium]|nr:DUF58 domain-containing protein [Acidobacteriota bacterium]MCB9378564.1 DUF58 domain-containing protein [Holophagales bacterium]
MAPRRGVGAWRRRLRDAWRRRGTPEGIRITKVGLWFVLLTIVVAIAATNTGNNSLYLVLASMLSLLAVSGIASRWNLRKLDIAATAPVDVYARRPFSLSFALRNRSTRLPRWLLLISVQLRGPVRLVPHLPAGATARGALDLMLPRRGRHRIEAAHVSSLFPLGFFRKGMRYRLDLELLVYPEIFAAGSVDLEASGLSGDLSAPRVGWGHELHSLRQFRQGDDPRNIHWKKTAQTGGLVFQEREAEENLRLSIVFDNGVGRLAEESERERFEQLVSEAATAAVDHLDRGFEVELVTRDRHLPFAAGGRQRRDVLETLALVEPGPRRRRPLAAGDASARQLRLTLPGGAT